MVAKFVVAFGPNESYYFCNGRKAIWKNLPEELVKFLKDDERFSADRMVYLALGPNKAYFIKSSVACAWGNVSPGAESKVDGLGGWSSIRAIVFTPDPDIYLIFDIKGQIVGRKLGQDFYDAILRYATRGYKEIALVFDGGHVLITNDNVMSYKGVTEEFVKTWKSGPVARVTTSTFDRFYFIEFEDGGSSYWCPARWHSAVDDLRKSVARTSSASSTTIATTNTEASAQLERARHKLAMAAMGTGFNEHGRTAYGV